MPTFDVTVFETYETTYSVEAEDEEAAREIAIELNVGDDRNHITNFACTERDTIVVEVADA